jgi:hypothetical protein
MVLLLQNKKHDSELVKLLLRQVENFVWLYDPFADSSAVPATVPVKGTVA